MKQAVMLYRVGRRQKDESVGIEVKVTDVKRVRE